MVGRDLEPHAIIAFVDALILDAIACRASDIHAEPLETGLRIRFRIDGVLCDRQMVAVKSMHHVISRIKVLANIDIAEKRIPQDGNFSKVIHNRLIDFRVATFPTLWGEKLVVRILDRMRMALNLSCVGLRDQMHKQFVEILERGCGLFLVTGPTGSGKTTTLYAALSYLNTAERHIITLEDPVEYHLEGITQGHIHQNAGFSFAKGLRALLRQDPDVLMVGEIRDRETANTALEAALTGHLVLSTLHTADAPRVIMRLLDMNIELFKINAALIGVLAQRLVRVLCEHCKVQRKPTVLERQLLTRHGLTLNVVFAAQGCENCLYTGYLGRVGIFQLLTMTESIRALLIQKPSLDEIIKQAESEGMGTLYTDGLEKVVDGITTIDELIKVVG